MTLENVIPEISTGVEVKLEVEEYDFEIKEGTYDPQKKI